MHWFSDVIAGTLFGYAIGSTVGNNFRKSFFQNDKPDISNRISILPIVYSDYNSLTIKIPF